MSFSNQLPTAGSGNPSLARGFTLPLPLGAYRPARIMLRRRRRPFAAHQPLGPYRLPKVVLEPLAADLADFRNAEAAFSLAHFLGRYWSARLDKPFAVCRQALAGHPDLRLTEAQIRGAIKTLEAAGFLERIIPENGQSCYRETEDGLKRKAIQFQFGGEYRSQFEQANKAARKARDRVSEAQRIIPAPTRKAPPASYQKALAANSPKWNPSTRRGMNLGEIKKLPTKALAPIEPNPALEAALERWRAAIQKS